MSLLDHLSSAKESIFRFEYLQDFTIPSEREGLEYFERTGEVDTSDMREWWDFLAELHAQGIKTERVRLVREPQTLYTRSELLVHKESLKHGDAITVLSEEKNTPILDTLGDFWLVDDTLVLRMNYTSAGEYLGFEKALDVEPYVSAKEYLLRNSAPLV